MLNILKRVVGVVAVLVVGAAGCSSPSTSGTDAQAPAASQTEPGTFVINPQFDGTEPFSEGLALVYIGDDEDEMGKYGFVDKTGAFVINPQFDTAESFSEGLAAVEIDGTWGFIAR